MATENNRTYTYKDHKFNGKKEAAIALKENPELMQSVLNDIIATDKDR